MRILKITVFILAICTTYVQAQSKADTPDQSRTIEIDNENGNLSITFENDIITEFIVNDTPIAKDQYDNYQAIIDAFAGEKVHSPTPPSPPNTSNNNDQSGTLHDMIIDYLLNENLISSTNKYRIVLKRKYLKINGKKAPQKYHSESLNLFDKVYGHKLNLASEVKFKKSEKNFSATVSIVD